MSELMLLDKEYKNWIQELLFFYWSIGKDITDKRASSKWGSKFFQNMSIDLMDMIPNAKSFSPTNLRYIINELRKQ